MASRTTPPKKETSSYTFDIIQCESATESFNVGSVMTTSTPTKSNRTYRLSHSTGCLQKTCLHPRLSLKYQLFLAFELVSIFSLLFVMCAGGLVAFAAGDRVKETSRSMMEDWSEEKFLISARVIAETTTKTLTYLEGASAMIRETTRDRFVGYPDHPGYSNDSLVPFPDSISGENIYPLKAKELLPFEWTADPTDPNTENAHELFGDRAPWYNYPVSMKLPTLHIQRDCQTWNVFQNVNVACLSPTATAIHRRASDYAPPVLKSLYEIHSTVKSLGIYFSNSGAGALVMYPGRTTSGSGSYISDGCDWMRNPNPLDPSKTIGTEATIAMCRPAGMSVSFTNHNPLERDWCSKQALAPNRYHFNGPYRDTWSQDQRWLMGIGRAVYDRITNEFIACTVVEISLESISKIIEEFRLTDTSQIALLRWDERGTVIKSEEWDANRANSTTEISELSLGVTTGLFATLKQRFVDAYNEDFSRTTFEKTDHVGGRVLSTFPVPVPPDTYDPDYVPEFMIILSVESSEIFSEVENVFDAVDDSVSFLNRIILVAGIGGLLTVTLCILLVSLYLTKPLEWMNAVGDQIVDSIGSSVKDNISPHESSIWMRLSPRTEILQLYQQFQIMVSRFAGQGTAKLQFHRSVEARNPFAMQAAFQDLYGKYVDSSLRYREESYEVRDLLYGGSLFERSPCSTGRSHWGPNHRPARGNDSLDLTAQGYSVSEIARRRKRVRSSPLFWWIFSSIALPLLLAMISISVVVTWNLIVVFPDLVHKVEDVFVNFEARSLGPLAAARADFAETITAISVRDLHVLARITGWVMFGGLQQANSFTQMGTGIEQCKTYPEFGQTCPYYGKYKTPCDCKWPTAGKGPTAVKCYNYESDPRDYQKTWWSARKLDAWPNGEVNFTSYPEVAFSAETTDWWDDQLTLPGHEEGLNATGMDTTFKVLHALSAVQMVQIPIVRYQGDMGGDTRGILMSMDKSGLMSGYLGCHHAHATFSHFQSNDITGAYRINPDLCPKGQFGFDTRCTFSYSLGKGHHLENGNPYLTPPYLFPKTQRIHQMFSAPLIDPKTRDYVGMTIVDFDGETIIGSLSQEMTPLPAEGFHVMVTAVRDPLGTDTVIAPGFTFQSLKKDKSAPIEKFVQKNDFQKCGADGIGEEGCKNIEDFTSNVLDEMRAGKQGSTSFTRINDAGKPEEVIWAYAPVKFRSLQPVDHSDFNAGVKEVERLVFSIALAHSDSSLHSTFSDAEEDMNRRVTTAVVVFAVLIGVAFVVVAFITVRVAASIIHSVNDLLVLVTSINQEAQGAHDEIAEVQGGSKEVRQVHRTFEKLHSVMRFANSSFFSGDLASAYDTLNQALAVFTKLKNEKALGVAHNNLGNIMLTMYRTMKETQVPMIAGLTKADVVTRGIMHFKKAIDIGEVAIEDINQLEGWSNTYLVFMQQLSNRYFNRAMFLLTVKEDHPDPELAFTQGSTDLSTAKDMDCEVVNNGDQQGFKGDDHVYFELLLTRIRGVLNLLDLGYDEDWELDDLFADARLALNKALRAPDTTMFQDMEPAGQMQLLDAELIRYYTREKRNEEAATVAIRMLKEDEYVIGEAGMLAIQALMNYLPEAEMDANISSTLIQYRRKISETVLLNQSLNHQQSEVSSSDVTRSSSKRNVQNTCVKQSNIGDISMEMF